MVPPIDPRALQGLTGDRRASVAPRPRAVHLNADDFDPWPVRRIRGLMRALRRIDAVIWGEGDWPVLDFMAYGIFAAGCALILLAAAVR